MIQVFRLEELFLDKKPISHFEYIVMQGEGGTMKFHIESNANPAAPEDATDNQFTVDCSDVMMMLRIDDDPEKFGCQARVGIKQELCFIMTITSSSAQEKICNGHYKSYSVFGYQGLRCFLTFSNEPKPMKIQNSIYLSNIETIIITRLYILAHTSHDVKGLTLKGKDILDDPENLLKAYFFVLDGEFDDEDLELKIFNHLVFSRKCFVCQEYSHKKCGKCSDASYCRRECQEQDWPKHKKLCKAKNAALKKYVNRKHPIRVQAYLESINKSPVVGFGKFRNIVVEKLGDAAFEILSKDKD